MMKNRTMHQKLRDTFAKYSKIILVGWGTGGHIQPILSIAQELGNQDILWIGGKDSNEEKQAKENKIPFVSIPTLKLTTTKSPKIFLYPFILLRGILEARKILREISADSNYNGGSGVETVWVWWKTENRWAERTSFSTPETFDTFGHKSMVQNDSKIALFSKGWPGSVAIGIAAWSLNIPLYIHESDTIPGRSNQLLGKIATKIFLGFESAKQYFDTKKCEVVGQILDPIFSTKSTNPPIHQAAISWKTDKKHILVICGSQGARSIFEAILEQFSDENPYEWIISLGKLNNGMKSDFENIQNIQALEWMTQEDIASLLGNTDIAITRGSATTLAEIDIFGVQKIIIPLPSAAKNHQYWNAREYEQKWDILLEQKNLTLLSETLKNHV